jgi:hypothetical protein
LLFATWLVTVARRNYFRGIRLPEKDFAMPFERFWRWYDRAARLDFAGTVVSYFFDWRGWIATFIGGSGGAVTFLWAAIDGRSPLDVWIAAVIVAAALAVFVWVIITIVGTLIRGTKPNYRPTIIKDGRNSDLKTLQFVQLFGIGAHDAWSDGDVLEPIREVWIHDEWFAARRLSIMRIMARRTKAATVVA